MVTSVENVAEALFGKTRRAVLGLLFSRPDERFGVRQIGRLTGSGIGGLQRELKRLCAAGIITREREGSQTFYRASSVSPVFEVMKGLVLSTLGTGAIVREALEPLKDRIRVAYLFGSQARGGQHSESDVDILVISDTLSLREVVEALAAAQRKCGREMNPIVYRPAEFARKRRAKQTLLARVAREPRLLLLGDADVFE